MPNLLLSQKQSNLILCTDSIVIKSDYHIRIVQKDSFNLIIYKTDIRSNNVSIGRFAPYFIGYECYSNDKRNSLNSECFKIVLK